MPQVREFLVEKKRFLVEEPAPKYAFLAEKKKGKKDKKDKPKEEKKEEKVKEEKKEEKKEGEKK